VEGSHLAPQRLILFWAIEPDKKLAQPPKAKDTPEPRARIAKCELRAARGRQMATLQKQVRKGEYK